MFKFLFKQKEMKKTETSVNEQKDLSSKEKYDLFWNKLFYAFFVLTSIGIIYMIKDVTKFRSELISLHSTFFCYTCNSILYSKIIKRNMLKSNEKSLSLS